MKGIAIHRVKLKDLLFFLALGLLIMNKMLGQSAMNWPGLFSKIVQIVILIILAAKWFIKRKYTFRKLVYACFVIVCSLSVYFSGGYGNVIVDFFLIISADDIDFRHIIKFSLYEMLAISGCFFLLSQIGMIPDYTYSRGFVNNGMVAHTYGFLYYAMPAYIVMIAIIEYCYLRGDKCRYVELLLLGILNALLYQVHTTRLALFIGFAFLLGYMIVFKLRLINIKGFFWKNIATLTPLASMLVMIWLVSLSAKGYFDLGKGFWETLNARFIYSALALKNYGVHLFGTEVQMVGSYLLTYGGATDPGIYIDSGYIYILVAYGLLFTALLLISHVALLKYLYKKNYIFCYLWLEILLLASNVNNFLLDPMFNPVLFLLPKAISEGIRVARKRIDEKSYHGEIEDIPHTQKKNKLPATN